MARRNIVILFKINQKLILRSILLEKFQQPLSTILNIFIRIGFKIIHMSQNWEIQWTEETGGLQSIGSQRVGHE